MQAGSSGRGREFAATWAELIFTGDPGIDIARAHYKDQKEKIGEHGRDPDSIKMCPMAYTVVGESEAHAEEREQLFLNDLVDPMASLTLLSELMNYDFSGLALDAPDHRRAHRVRVGHPGAGAEHPGAHRRRHGDAGRPGRPPGHPAAGTAVRRDRARGRRPDGGVVRRRRLRRLRHRRHALARAPTRTSSAWWCPSCSAGASSATATPARRCAGISGSSAPSQCTVPDTARPLQGLRVVDAATLAAGRWWRRRSASSAPR